MQSVANSGLKPKILEYYKRNIVQVYAESCVYHLTTINDIMCVISVGYKYMCICLIIPFVFESLIN